MSDDVDPAVMRFLELLAYKIGWNVLARITITAGGNAALKVVHYRTAPISIGHGFTSSAKAPAVISGDINVEADLIRRVFRYALANEDAPTSWHDGRLVFFDVLSYPHEDYQTFVMLVLKVQMI